MHSIPQDGNEPKALYLKSVPVDVQKIVMDEQQAAQEHVQRRVSFTETLYKIIREWRSRKLSA